jgi:DNA-binding MarR family transcriptional regulator
MFDDALSTPSHLVSLAYRSFVRLSESRLKPLGFSPGLVALQSGHAKTQKELAQFAKIEQPPMAQMLKRMERDGLIERVKSKDDGRSAEIVLSRYALSKIPEALKVLIEGNEEVLHGFPKAESMLLCELLSRLNSNLDKMIA